MVVLRSTQVGDQRDTNKDSFTSALYPLRANPPSFPVTELRQILGLSFSLALISVKGKEVLYVAMILKHASRNPPILPHRHAAEIDSIALEVAEEFTVLGGYDLR